MAQVNNALIVGRTSNTEAKLDAAPAPRGIIAPRTDAFLITGARFYNYDWNEAAAFGSCSHCYHGASTANGALTTTVSNITFD
jgi:hypothetical protein